MLNANAHLTQQDSQIEQLCVCSAKKTKQKTYRQFPAICGVDRRSKLRQFFGPSNLDFAVTLRA